MKSIVTHQYPQIKFKDGEKYLWNPIQKKALKNRPEERIRLRVIEYLLAAKWSKHRISTEEHISSSQERNLRTDLICYNDQFDPLLLIECKAPDVKISGQTAEQIARYNNKVSAPHLLLTNGRKDFWYSFKNKREPVLQDEIPSPFQKQAKTEELPFEYWAARRFAGRKAAPKLRAWLVEILNSEFCDNDCRYLSFKKDLFETDLNHYYIIHSISEVRIALSFIGTAYGGTRLLAIQNKGGKNKAVLEINLDLLFDDKRPNASLYNSKGQTNIDIQRQVDWNEQGFKLQPFAEKLNTFFNQSSFSP